MSKQDFGISVILSVVKNRMLCPFTEYRALLDHLTGVTVPLWDVARARTVCAAWLTKTFPELAAIANPPEKTDSGNANKYVQVCKKELGGKGIYDISGGRVKFTERTLSKTISAR